MAVIAFPAECSTLALGSWLETRTGYNPTVSFVRATGIELSPEATLAAEQAAVRERGAARCIRDRDSGSLYDGAPERAREVHGCPRVLTKAEIARACGAFLGRNT